MRKSILIISQDRGLCEEIKSKIDLPFTEIAYTDSCQTGYRLHNQFPYCLIILEVREDNEECLFALYHLRNSSNVPILVLQAGEDMELLRHLYNLGADDVVTLPPDFEILQERTRAMIRRYTEYHGAEPGRYAVIVCQDLEIDPQARLVTREGKRLNLRQREFDLLYYLAINKGQVLTYDQIYERIWQQDKTEAGIANHVSNLVRNLRDKLDEDDRQSIENVRGYGYRYNPEFYEWRFHR